MLPLSRSIPVVPEIRPHLREVASFTVLIHVVYGSMMYLSQRGLSACSVVEGDKRVLAGVLSNHLNNLLLVLFRTENWLLC